MTTRALVLGGGGPVGVAWQAGLAAGLAREGVRIADADLIVGTSAGAIVGSQLALGRAPSDLAEQQRQRAARERASGAAGPPPDLRPLIDAMRRSGIDGPRSQQALAEIGAFALTAQTISEEEWFADFGSVGVMGIEQWPERRFVCTAIDTADGAFVTWDKDSGVALGRAVASSGAVPGLYPPVTINGRRYMDGGMRSMINADLARGFDVVLVIAVTPGHAQIAEALRQRIGPELEELRAGGSRVELIVPDAAALAAFGPNLMDRSRRARIVDEGVRQGTAEASRVREFWMEEGM
jgi:NTE family protein